MSTCFNNADHDNPLDPMSGEYQNLGTLEGHVYTYYAPFLPIESALITLFPGNQTTFTDHQGAFYFIKITPGNYVITANYADYAPDTVQAQVISHQTTSIQLNLDGLPVLDSLSLAIGFKHEYIPFEPSRLVDCNARVSDPDGPADIESVAMFIPFFDYKDTLGMSPTMGFYQKSYEERNLPIDHIEQLLGHAVFIEITDKVGKMCRYGPNYLIRVIDEEPEIESPKESALVSAQPKLKWKSLQLPYSFSFKVDIYAIVGNQIQFPAIRTYSEISSDITDFHLSKPLNSSLYLWTVSIVDRWGDWSRSKPATFQVGE
ncbi:MAG: carboxypeptidase regulatory-like domain-containing protein [bacterium]|nr:MAG: carboxypeptidase regulatory-like domain-containing protein [bacterium]